jgi:ATP-dependent Clp protease, protease subunit
LKRGPPISFWICATRGSLSGQATDIDIHAKEILRMRAVINRLIADHSGQSIERIEQDVERDFIMSAQQAKEYGLIDKIIQKHGQQPPSSQI